jgi:hypothetical protein
MFSEYPRSLALALALVSGPALISCQEEAPTRTPTMTGRPEAETPAPVAAQDKVLDCYKPEVPIPQLAASSGDPAAAQAAMMKAAALAMEPAVELAAAPDPVVERDLRARYARYTDELKRQQPALSLLSPEQREEQAAALKSRIILGR